MKQRLFFVVFAAVAYVLAAMPARAQEKEPARQYLTVHQDNVRPSSVVKYEKAAKNFADMIAKNKVSGISYVAATMTDFTYIYFTPVENMAALDKMEGAWSELEKKAGKEAFEAAMSQFDGCYDSHKNYMVRLRPDLSYNPDYGSKISDGMLFRHWDFYYVHPGMEDEAEEISKEWVALNKKVGLPDGYRLYTGSYGSDNPVIIVAQSGKDAVDFYSRQEAWMKKAGDAGRALMEKTWTIVWKYESRDGMIRPDISVLPKETEKK